jgi:hypothetical protein
MALIFLGELVLKLNFLVRICFEIEI